MKKIISMILALILMFTLASCTKSTVPIVSSTLESDSEVSVEEISALEISPPALDGISCTAYGIQFEINEGWQVKEIDGFTYVFFTNSSICGLIFAEPENIGATTLSQHFVEGYAEDYASFFESDVVVGNATITTIDGNDVWFVNIGGTLSGEQIESTIWLYKDGATLYVWVFMGTPEEYETYFPYAQALIKSMKLPVS